MNARSFRHWVFVALVACATVACGDGNGPVGPPAVPSITGQWSGSAGVGVTLSILLVEPTPGELTGSGSIVGPGASVALTAAGVYDYPNFSITFSAAGFEGMNLSGTINQQGTTLAGFLNGSGYDSFGVNLRRP